jgi:hypothetical protein
MIAEHCDPAQSRRRRRCPEDAWQHSKPQGDGQYNKSGYEVTNEPGNVVNDVRSDKQQGYA